MTNCSDKPAVVVSREVDCVSYTNGFNIGEGSADKGCIILPCELVEQNGDKLKALILQYADLWELDPAFKSWVEEQQPILQYAG